MDQEYSEWELAAHAAANEQTAARLWAAYERALQAEVEEAAEKAVRKRSALVWRGQARPWFRSEY